MLVAALCVKDANKDRIYKNTVHADKTCGIAGGPPPKEERRQLSLQDTASAGGSGGLCASRFAANIVTSGLDYAALNVGTRLGIGGAVIEITQIGKRCFEECEVYSRGEYCRLKHSCAFARVISEGDISTGDGITVIENA